MYERVLVLPVVLARLCNAVVTPLFVYDARNNDDADNDDDEGRVRV